MLFFKKGLTFIKSFIYQIKRSKKILKHGSHRSDKLHRPSSSPETNVVGTIKGSSSKKFWYSSSRFITQPPDLFFMLEKM